MENKFGYFEAETGAFVITDVLTPRPWTNVLANEQYGLVLSQAGGGFSWAGNCQLFRLSRWEQDLVADAYGRFLYVQDLVNPDEIWSTTYQPTRRKAEVDEVRHEIGATTFTRRFMGLETRHKVFVPHDACAEVWIVEIENLSSRPRQLKLGSFLEWHVGTSGDAHREFHRLFVETKARGLALLAWKHSNLVEHERTIPNPPVRALIGWSGVDDLTWITDKRDWLGACGDPASPKAFAEGARPSKNPRWGDPVAGGIAVVELAPGETRTITITIGAADDEESAWALAGRYDEITARASLEETLALWDERCVLAENATGDAAIDLMANRWLPYQAIAGRLYARCAYYQQGGAYGYRDQLQDSLMLLDRDPAQTLIQLGRHAEAMYDDGGVRHWWHPGTKIFAESHHSDTCLWLAYGVLEYVTKTGDLGAMDLPFGFLDRKTQDLGTTGSLWQHCLRGIERTLGRMSPRGLPLICAGDWNDGLSHAGLEGRGESVWLAMFLYDILSRWQPFLDRRGDTATADAFRAACEQLKHSVNEFGWDGEWYIAGTRDDGKPFGSRTCEEGKIFLNPQTWAVISGIAPPERVERAMQSVRERLVTPYGALLLRPAYSSVDPYIGYITRYAPGLRENGGVYSHASTWAVLAFAMIDDKETARAIYRGMLPPLRAAAGADLYAAEPYVMPGNVDGPDSPFAGRAGWTWYTGAAAWMVRVRPWIADSQLASQTAKLAVHG